LIKVNKISDYHKQYFDTQSEHLGMIGMMYRLEFR